MTANVMTLEHAATHLGVPVTTLHEWRATGHLIAVEHPCVRGEWLVDTQHLLEVDLAMHRGTATTVVVPPLTARALAVWLTTQDPDHPVSYRAVIDAVADGDLVRVDEGGPGKAAYFDAHQAVAVFAARKRRIPVVPAQRGGRTRPSPRGAPTCSPNDRKDH